MPKSRHTRKKPVPTKKRKEFLQKNLNELNKEIATKAKLIAVSKTYPASDIKLAYELGQRDFGENKVQELAQKAAELVKTCPEIRWHLIGPLQSNKINLLTKVPHLYAIHSIDSLKILDKIHGKTQAKLFLQVNTSGEEEKHGFAINEVTQELIRKYNIYGLMTLSKIRTENFETDAKKCFSQLAQLKKRLNPELKLSMGMSSDYKMALELGSDYLRIGSLIFGERS